MEGTENASDFTSTDFNGFFYTTDSHIRSMDDGLILAKIIERYPDFSPDRGENMIKQVFLVIANDTKFINSLTKMFDITPIELFQIIFKKYSYIFNKCYTTKLQKVTGRKSYVRNATR